MKKIFFLILCMGLVSGCEMDVPVGFPSLSEVKVTETTALSARFSSSIEKSGNVEILEHGFVFSLTDETPAVEEQNSVKRGGIERIRPTPVPFANSVEQLTPGTTYYVWAFVETPSGASFSDKTEFRTTGVAQAAIRTDGAEVLGTQSARLTGTVTAKGTYPITERGIVWGENTNPTIDNQKGSIPGDVSSFPNTFVIDAHNLRENTSYHYRAYLVSNGVTSYGENRTFRTNEVVKQPKIETGGFRTSTGSATLFGRVTERGSHDINEYGVVWGSSPDPGITDSKASAGGNIQDFPREFSVEARGLSPGTTYHYRAYVMMNGVTTYGDNKTFSLQVDPPVIRTGTDIQTSASEAHLYGTVERAGSHPVSEMGLVWGTMANPTTNDYKYSQTGEGVSLPHSFKFAAVDLSPNTTYYVRAYAVAGGEVYYGERVSFRTPRGANPPGVSTSPGYGVDNNSTAPFYRVTGTVIPTDLKVVETGFYYLETDGSFDLQAAKAVMNRYPNGISRPTRFSGNLPFATKQYRAYAVDEQGNRSYGDIVKIVPVVDF